MLGLGCSGAFEKMHANDQGSCGVILKWYCEFDWNSCVDIFVWT